MERKNPMKAVGTLTPLSASGSKCSTFGIPSSLKPCLFHMHLYSIERKVDVKAKIPAPPPSDVQILDIHNWDSIVGKTDRNILVSFTVSYQVSTNFLLTDGFVI